MIERATPLKTAIVNQVQGMARPVTHTGHAGGARRPHGARCCGGALVRQDRDLPRLCQHCALSRMTGLPHLASLAIVVVAIIGFCVAVFVGIGPTIDEQGAALCLLTLVMPSKSVTGPRRGGRI